MPVVLSGVSIATQGDMLGSTRQHKGGVGRLGSAAGLLLGGGEAHQPQMAV